MALLLRSTGMNPPQSYLEDLFEKYDADGNGVLSFGEFAIMWHSVGEEFAGDDELSLVEEAFKFFDTDGGGTIEKTGGDALFTPRAPSFALRGWPALRVACRVQDDDAGARRPSL